MKKRADIDGLRAIAIAPVILYHAGASWFPGGFVGVDVFFVISGYLITGIISREIASGQFSLTHFYLRRAKRILPSLFLVLGTTWLISLFLLTPEELANLGRMIAGTSAFVSNILFFRETGYFDTVAETKPLLMTWSLGIEEQFYILWPLVLLSLSKLRGALPIAIGSIGLVSFSVSCWEVARGSSAAFFLLPGRAWELLLGASLALRPGFLEHRRRPESLGHHLTSLVGLAMILSGTIGLDRASAFPAWNAVPACIGTLCLIWSGESAVVNRYILSSPPLVYLGLVSYPLYLWHWPLFSLAHILKGPGLAAAPSLALVATALVLSVATWRLIETPLRRTPARVPSRALARYGVLTAAFIGLGTVTYLADGFPGRASPAALKADAARRDLNPLRSACLIDPGVGLGVPPGGEECNSGRPGQDLAAIWGDSHADALAPGVRLWAERSGYGLVQLTARACPPLPTATTVMEGSAVRGCDAFNRRATEFLVTSAAVKTVFLAARWAIYTENSRFGDEPGAMAYLVDERHADLTRNNSRRVFDIALTEIVVKLEKAGKTVVVIGQVPEIGKDAPACHERRARLEWLGMEAESCSVGAAVVAARLDFTNQVILRLAPGKGRVRAFLPSTVLCSGGECQSQLGGIILYSDDDHPSASGARYLAERFPPGAW